MTMKPNVILTLIIVILTLAGCKNAHNNDDGVSEIRYTCPMHPTVISNEPGTCPVCNMSLVKVEPNTDNHSGMNGSFVTLDKRRQQLAGIEMDTVKLRHVMSSSTFLGTVAIDERTARNISSRVKGRIDKLFVKADGVYVKRGTALYSIYSEQLQLPWQVPPTAWRKFPVPELARHLSDQEDLRPAPRCRTQIRISCLRQSPY